MPITLTASSRAAQAAQQLANQANQLATNASSGFTNGVAASGANPSCTGADIQAALGPNSTAQLKLLIATVAATDTTKLANALAALT